MESKSHSAVLVGEKGILISCAEVWLATGNTISAVVSDSATIRNWCNTHQVNHLSWDQSTEAELTNLQCDYLFSLANLRILPEAVLNTASIAAINFHDGPLPDYTGVNTPSWAIINGESSHAISFHRMTAEVDHGEVLIHKSFEINADTTSLTANAACFELALEAFKELIQHLPAAQTIAPTTRPQRNSNHYRKSDLPDFAGVLDFTQTSLQLDRLIRALDFGQYENPMCAAKIWNGESLVHIASAVVKDTPQPKQPPGTVTHITDHSITVCCADGEITLAELTNTHGDKLSGASIKQFAEHANKHLPDLSLTPQDTNLLANSANHEDWWIKTLAASTPLTLPFHTATNAAPQSSAAPEITQHGVDGSISSAHTLAVIVAYLARMNQRTELDLGYLSATTDNKLTRALIQETLNCSVSIDATDTTDTLADKLSNSIKTVTAKGHYLKDLKARQGAAWQPHRITFGFNKIDPSNFPDSDLHIAIAADGKSYELGFDPSVDIQKTANRIDTQLQALFNTKGIYSTTIKNFELLTPEEKNLLHKHWNATTTEYQQTPVHTLFEQSAVLHADKIALAFESQSATYRDLDEKSNQLANRLIASGLKPQQKAGVLMDRSIEMIVALYAVLKCGAAYVPLDPTYPAARLNHMVKDAGLSSIICDEHLKTFLDTEGVPLHIVTSDDFDSGISTDHPNIIVAPEDLAYVIYTSGSTGLPKGVMVEHRNVANFFTAMDREVKPPYKTWLAVTSISFDISVLEIFWTLARGFKVVLYSDDRRQKSQSKASSRYPEQSIDLSLFYWNVAQEDSIERQDKYRLLMEGAKFADDNGFAAVWNPERHFAAFGGSFPNPAVTCAAIAATTKNVHIRAGSCVAPLHSPIRIAEDWSVVDNLSNGRAGVAFASGWAPPDFAILPDNFENAKTIMFEHMEKVQRLWRGDKVEFDGPKGKVSVRTLPRPIQPELPVWITTAGNIDSYKSAGTLGANILTHLLGQTLEEVNEKAAAYHEAWRAAGHKGKGKITLMLHTFVGESKESVKAIVHEPMKEYLKSAMFLVKAAAWNFPTFKKLSEESGTSIDNFFETLTDDDLDALLDFAFERYFETSGLFGSVHDAAAMIDNCKAHGIDEIACLIDYGVDDQLVLDHLPYLAELREAACTVVAQVDVNDYSIAALVNKHNVTHLQCTPSMASLLLADDASKAALKQLDHLLVGGEALPDPLAKELVATVSHSVTNMYGPTETTIWSSTSTIDDSTSKVSIGRPIANTQIYIVDENACLLPQGIPGELVIAGDGVVRGYHNNQQLTDERFIADPYSNQSDAKMYRTGDLATYAEDGTLVYLGRLDHQVKLHGYRIELGEIESALGNLDKVAQAAVVVREDTPNDRRIVAYIVTESHTDKPDTDKLRDSLKESLPSFMVPSTFVQLQALPLTPNGKIDRNALPVPVVAERSDSKEITAPENDLEATIADCWKQSLGISAVGRNDNFFDIGGNSILLLDVLARLNKQESITHRIKVTDVFRYSTVEALAGFLNQSLNVNESDSSTPANTKTSATGRASSRRAAMNRRRRATSATSATPTQPSP